MHLIDGKLVAESRHWDLYNRNLWLNPDAGIRATEIGIQRLCVWQAPESAPHTSSVITQHGNAPGSGPAALT